ncbi:MAG TPA: hypothetical protein PLH83_00360 [Ruminococcus sp.]|nr:hypothetical protein [Ruminococcus sp.]
MKDILEKICAVVWGELLVFLLLGTGLICTFRLSFVQLRLFSGLKKELSQRREKTEAFLSCERSAFLWELPWARATSPG